MKKVYIKIAILTLVCIFLGNAQNMNMKEYNIALNNAIQTEKQKKEQIAKEQVNIENLQREIKEAVKTIRDIIGGIYSTLGIVDEDVSVFKSDLSEAIEELTSISSLETYELKLAKNRIDAVKSKLETLKNAPASKLLRFKSKLQEAYSLQKTVDDQYAMANQQKDAESQTTYSKPQTTYSGNTYTVKSFRGNGDCLWNIAVKLFDDPVKWGEIYNLNKDIVSNPNLLFPGQVLKLPE